ncbi:MAG TPA: GIY-YIG nuclease family protein [Syntrophomonadaceae bacterium]|nr:GIY-YIG nuclease family protein [Syntrophomonadaceae bacterium]
MAFVYILECCDGTLYTGYANNVAERLKKHQQGIASKYTRSRLPVKLVYYEELQTKSEALKRELAIKNLNRCQKQMLIEEFKQK